MLKSYLQILHPSGAEKTSSNQIFHQCRDLDKKKSSSYFLPRNQSLGISASLSRVSISSNSSLSFKAALRPWRPGHGWCLFLCLLVCYVLSVFMSLLLSLLLLLLLLLLLVLVLMLMLMLMLMLLLLLLLLLLLETHPNYHRGRSTAQFQIPPWPTVPHLNTSILPTIPTNRQNKPTDETKHIDQHLTHPVDMTFFFAFSTRRFIHPKW